MYYFAPMSDMFETADSVVVQMELAGVKKEDINVEVYGSRLEISGMKRRKRFAEEDSFQRMERPFGFFKRVFDLPYRFDGNSISASFDEGLLEIIIPKRNKTGGFNFTDIEIEDV